MKETRPGVTVRRPSTTTLNVAWSSLVSGVILIALVGAGGLLYWRITTSYSAAHTPARVGAPSNPQIPGTPPGVKTSPRTLGSVSVSSKVDFSCTLPLTAYARRARLSLPSGTVTVDLDEGPAPANTDGTSYVRGQWFPVPPAWVSPNGRSFVSTSSGDGTSAQHSLLLTDSSSGDHQELWKGSSVPTVLGWDAGSIYFMLLPTSGAGPASADTGLWMADPARPGHAHRVGPDLTSLASISSPHSLLTTDTKVGGGGAWDTSQPSGVARGRVERMDLKKGTVSVWYTAPADTSVFILGFDARGRPVLALTGGDRSETRQLLLLTGQNQTVTMLNQVSGAPRYATAFGDSHGIWIGSSGALWLFRSNSLFKVADVPVGAVGAQTPIPIDNAVSAGNQLPPPRVVGPCA